MTINWHTPWISLTSFDVLWQTWCLDSVPLDPDKPLMLDCSSPGKTPSERRRITGFAYQELAEATSHLNRGGMRELYPLLAALAAPDREIDLRWYAPQPFRAMAVRHRGLGVVALKTDTHVCFGLGDPATQASDLVDFLPARSAAQMHRREPSLDAALLRTARARINGVVDADRQQPWTTMRNALRDVGVPDDVSRAFANLVPQECVGRGEFRVVLPGRIGQRRRASSWIRVNDTDKGRYLLTIDARGWITMRSADNRAVADQLRATVHRLTSYH